MQDDLIARIEAADGPDRDLNYALLMRLGWSRDEGYAVNPAGNRVMRVPDFTASFDDAMTLVPEGWRMWSADFSIAGRFVWMLSGPKQQWIIHEDGSKEGGDDWYQSGVGKTPALALTAAAIRATPPKPDRLNGEGA